MLSEKWKVILILCASACAFGGPGRALAPYSRNMLRNTPRNMPPFAARNKRKSRNMFLDEDEGRRAVGRGEIDLTRSQIKFDDSADYEFTGEEAPSGHERFYDNPRLRLPYARYARPYSPGFGYDYPSVRASLYQPQGGWKARSPRVVFPYQEPTNSLAQTNSHSGPTPENVVFREQNFGLGDVPSDELALQDITTGAGADAFAERDANDLHRARNDDTSIYDVTSAESTHHRQLSKPMFIQTDGIRILPSDLDKTVYFTNSTRLTYNAVPRFKPISDDQMRRINEILKSTKIETSKSTNLETKGTTRARTGTNRKGRVLANLEDLEDRRDEKSCPQGGTCEFFVYCWMVGGLLEGTCGGLLKGCCHRVAKSGLLGVQDSNSIETTNEVNYGPVLNDISKC